MFKHVRRCSDALYVHYDPSSKIFKDVASRLCHFAIIKDPLFSKYTLKFGADSHGLTSISSTNWHQYRAIFRKAMVSKWVYLHVKLHVSRFVKSQLSKPVDTTRAEPVFGCTRNPAMVLIRSSLLFCTLLSPRSKSSVNLLPLIPK